MKIKNYLEKFFCFLIIAFFSFSSVASAAISPDQRALYNKNILYYDLSCGDDAGEAEITTTGGNVDKFLKALAYQESGGDPRQPGSAGGARGKYQYIDSTWQSRFAIYGPASSYNQAHLAPEQVQDAVAYIEYAVKFKELNNSLFKLAVSHFYPAANADKGLLDVVPPSNVITPRQYAEKLINSIKKGGEWEKIPLRYDEAPEFDTWLKKAGVEAGNPDAGSAGGSVYMVGDSITKRAETPLKNGLKSNDFKPYINFSEGRSIRGAGTSDDRSSGLKAVDDDKARVKNAGNVIVALGTNTENDFEGAMREMVKKIRSYNSEVKIFWVNVFSKGGGSGYHRIDRSTINNTINKVSADMNFAVIDTTKPGANIADNLDDSVHPNPEGTKNFANIVVDAVSQNRPSASEQKAVKNCVCEADQDSKVTGSNNTEIAFNFLVDKGLSPMHAAAMVGNFIHESGGDPIKTDNPNPSSGATGIAHWLGGRLSALQAKANWTDINVQLNYLWDEDLPAQEKGGFPALSTLKTTTNLKDAVEKFEAIFERSGDTGSYSTRLTYAKNVLAKYGSGGSGESADASACSAGQDGEVIGDFALPVPRKWYKSNPEYFTKPHHDYAASDIPVPRGTPVYSMTAGKITGAPNGGGFGNGVTIDAGNGLTFIYGHGIDGGSVPGAKLGDTVRPGQLLMHVNNTGQSFGDHLHLEIQVNGEKRCPQNLFVSIMEGNPVNPKSLASSGCSN